MKNNLRFEAGRRVTHKTALYSVRQPSLWGSSKKRFFRFRVRNYAQQERISKGSFLACNFLDTLCAHFEGTRIHMKSNFLFLMISLTTSTFSYAENLFTCPTDNGDKISAQENNGKLNLKINNDTFTSDESISDIKKQYFITTKKDKEYRVISFTISGVKYNLGSFKSTPTQEEPDAKLFTYDTHAKISDYICSFGEDVNNFDFWKK